jgi:Mrp family chromosome partitioning ATPase
MLCSVKLNQFMAESQKQYDFVLFDTPALSTVIDGALVASKTDGVILIAEIGTTKLTALNRAKQQLQKADANIMGVVLTRVKKRDYIKYVESYNYFERFNRAT